MHFRSSVQSLAPLNYHDSGRILIARSAHGGILLTSRGLSKEGEHLLHALEAPGEKKRRQRTKTCFSWSYPGAIPKRVVTQAGWEPLGWGLLLPTASCSTLTAHWQDFGHRHGMLTERKRLARFFIPYSSIYAGVADVQGHCSQLSCCIWIPDTPWRSFAIFPEAPTKHRDLWNGGTIHTHLATNTHGRYLFYYIVTTLAQFSHQVQNFPTELNSSNLKKFRMKQPESQIL